MPIQPATTQPETAQKGTGLPKAGGAAPGGSTEVDLTAIDPGRIAVATLRLDRDAASNANFTGVGAAQAVRTLLPTPEAGSGPTAPHGWIGFIPYETGVALEPAARRSMHTPSKPNDATLDRPEAHWIPVCPAPERSENTHEATRSFELGGVQTIESAVYKDAVREAVGLIRAGDAFQVNLAHAVRRPFRGSPRAFFAALAGVAKPRHAVYLERQLIGTRTGAGMGAEPRGGFEAICSFSPELFLAYDAGTRRVVTRPMKGTRPAGADPEALERDPKDRAELAMIVDLMRNDLGRVCRFGSVRVEEAHTLEPHGDPARGVLQGVATIAGVLREDRSPRDLVAACFPPGSITGAPKIRAMQIIADLERSMGLAERGAYCGCAGRVLPDGSLRLNVSIRTATVRGVEVSPGVIEGEAVFPVGAGIVADSDPESEWQETLVKARVFTDPQPGPRPGRHGAPAGDRP